MPSLFTKKQKNEILKKILKRANQFYENAQREKERATAEGFVDNFSS